jgi:hypothetical protein
LAVISALETGEEEVQGRNYLYPVLVEGTDFVSIGAILISGVTP